MKLEASQAIANLSTNDGRSPPSVYSEELDCDEPVEAEKRGSGSEGKEPIKRLRVQSILRR